MKYHEWKGEIENITRMYFDELKERREIAEHYGITRVNLDSIFARYKIIGRSSGGLTGRDRYWVSQIENIRQMHYKERRTVKYIAHHYKVSYDQMGKVMRKHGIKCLRRIQIEEGKKAGNVLEGLSIKRKPKTFNRRKVIQFPAVKWHDEVEANRVEVLVL